MKRWMKPRFNYRYFLLGFLFLLICGSLFATASAQNEWTKYINRTGVDLLTGNSGNAVRINMSHSFSFTQRFSAGIGAGYAFYGDPLDLVPVYFDLAYSLGSGLVAPFVQLKIGRSFSVLHDRDYESDRHGGGFILNPKIGIWVKPENEPGLYFTAGFNMDHSYLEQDSFENRTFRDSISYRRVSLGFGLILP